MALNISGLTYFLPLFGFLFVFLIVFAVLKKTKILGEGAFTQIFMSFIIAIIFATVTGVRKYVQTVVPWFAVLLIALFLILVIVGLSQQKIENIMKPWFVWVFIVVLIIVFLISAINVFNPVISPYLPGGSRDDGTITGFIYSSKFLGSILLLGIAALVSWVIAKKDK